MSFEWIEESLRNDPYEMNLCSVANKLYKKNHKSKYNGEWRNMKGIEMEQSFRDYLNRLCFNRTIKDFEWLSFKNKSDYDFVIVLHDSSLVYVDIVSTHENNIGNIMLYTSHKDYKKKIKAIDNGVGYIGFIYNNEWRFIRVSRKLPFGDITITKNRSKHVKKASYVFKLDVLNPYTNCALSSEIMQHSSLKDCVQVF